MAKRINNQERVTPTQVVPPAIRDDEFFSTYANNVRYESTVYDLRLIFGHVDLEGGKETVLQHTAIAIPWPLVKLLHYFLQINMLFHQAQNGKIVVPPSQIPPEFPLPAGEVAKNSEIQQVVEMANKIREELISGL
jgi:hypothetical protein